MAVVQISRIQVRRGKSLSGTGLPQLASGELAWALDTQELYIGNGSVSEGSPAVGNTKILTERDLTVQGNLLNLIKHIYKSDDPAIQTGPSVNTPISRTTQARLDDRVTAADFGAVADGATDDTEALQRAIDQLFLNPTTTASGTDADSAKARVVLELAPGIYKTSATLYVPSFASLVGAGKEKTIISYSGTGPAIQFVNDDSTIGNPSSLGGTQYNKQPRYINLSGMTVTTDTDNQTVLKLDAVRNSTFSNLSITGGWTGVYDADSIGIALNAVSSIVTCENNTFTNINITGFSYGVWAKTDILNNVFRDCSISSVRQGFVLGEDADGTTVGEQYGPRETEIVDCKFTDIMRHAVYVGLGTGNTTRDCKLTNVGNDGSGVYFPSYPQIYFESVGNTSQNDQSDRETFLASKTFTVTLDLNYPITVAKGAEVFQNVSNVRGTVKDDYSNSSSIVVVTRYLTPFNTTNTLVIDNDYTPGNLTTIEISSTSSLTNQFHTADSTADMFPGTEITFNSTPGGVVAGTIYYIKDIIDSTHFTIANTYTDAMDSGVLPRTLTTTGITSIASYTPTVHPTVVGDLELVPYIPEIGGHVKYNSYATNEFILGFMPSWSLVCTLPISTGASGTPSNSVSYDIPYQFKSVSNNFTRKGTITLVMDIDESASTHSTKAQLSDDYNVVGIDEESALLLEFSAVLLNQYGSEMSGVDDVPSSIALLYKNAIPDESLSTFSYSYTATH